MIKSFVAIIIVGSPDVLKWLSYARFTNLKARNRGKKLQVSAIKGVLSRITSISLKSQDIYLCHRKPTNNGLFLLPMGLLVCK